MGNPWETISLRDYETHMSLDSVGQLQALNAVMGEQLADYRASRVMILGVAGGNGLEHIRADRVERVYGVDVNAAYLRTCVHKWGMLAGRGILPDSLSAAALRRLLPGRACGRSSQTRKLPAGILA